MYRTDVDVAIVGRILKSFGSHLAAAKHEARVAEVLLLAAGGVTSATLVGARNVHIGEHGHFEGFAHFVSQLESVFVLAVGVLHILAATYLLQAVEVVAVNLTANSFKHINARVADDFAQLVRTIHETSGVVVGCTRGIQQNLLAYDFIGRFEQGALLVILRNRTGNSYYREQEQ